VQSVLGRFDHCIRSASSSQTGFNWPGK
jgi:hypothetical protein